MYIFGPASSLTNRAWQSLLGERRAGQGLPGGGTAWPQEPGGRRDRGRWDPVRGQAGPHGTGAGTSTEHPSGQAYICLFGPGGSACWPEGACSLGPASWCPWGSSLPIRGSLNSCLFLPALPSNIGGGLGQVMPTHPILLSPAQFKPCHPSLPVLVLSYLHTPSDRHSHMPYLVGI